MELKRNDLKCKSSTVLYSASLSVSEGLEAFIDDLRDWTEHNFILTEQKHHSPCPYPPELLRSKSLYRALLNLRSALVSARTACVQSYWTVSQDLERAQHHTVSHFSSLQQEVAALKDSVNSPLRTSYHYLVDELTDVKSTCNNLTQEICTGKRLVKELIHLNAPYEFPLASVEPTLVELLMRLKEVMQPPNLKSARKSVPVLVKGSSSLRKLEQMNKDISKLIGTLR